MVFLAGSDELNVWYVLGAATAGAILGDSGGYWLGYYGGWPLLVRVGKILNVPETALVGLRDRFSKNADKAVLLGRFVTLLRVFAGPLAGITKNALTANFCCAMPSVRPLGPLSWLA